MTPRPGTAVRSQSDPPKVLLVDDEATGRRLLRRWIERGFDGHVVEASNGLEALEALAAEEFDLVVLDLMMPVLDGTETLSLIRADPSHGDLEVVVATQLASEQKVRDVISLGVADYILKPLRYESVVDRLNQIIIRTREKKKERLRHNDLPTILIADPDPNFCDFAVSALAGRFRGIASRTAAETLVGVLKNEPELVMLSATLPGLPFEILGKKVLTLADARHGKVCLLTDVRADSIDKVYCGQVVRTFVPENFANEVAKLVAGASAVGGDEPWLKALEPEITTAVRQAMGMMTGFEPTPIAQPVGGEPDLFGMIDLRAESGEFDLVVDLRCRRSFAVELCNTMLGEISEEVDNEFLMSGVGEILNVVGGRIKNSCLNRKIAVLLGLPQLLHAPVAGLDAFYQWEQHFLWQNDHCFRLGVSGKAGTVHPAKSAPKSSSAAAGSDTAEPKPANSEPASPEPASTENAGAKKAAVEAAGGEQATSAAPGVVTANPGTAASAASASPVSSAPASQTAALGSAPAAKPVEAEQPVEHGS
jgi:CheY-like chemotaxis protein